MNHRGAFHIHSRVGRSGLESQSGFSPSAQLQARYRGSRPLLTENSNSTHQAAAKAEKHSAQSAQITENDHRIMAFVTKNVFQECFTVQTTRSNSRTIDGLNSFKKHLSYLIRLSCRKQVYSMHKYHQ